MLLLNTCRFGDQSQLTDHIGLLFQYGVLTKHKQGTICGCMNNSYAQTKAATNTTLANRFKELREAQELTLEGVAARTNANRSTIWKIENGKPVSPHTLSQSAKVGLGLTENSEEYAELVALWIVSRGLSDEPQLNIATALNRITNTGSKRLANDAAKIASIMQPLSLTDQRSLVSAMEKPEALNALIALAHHYA